MNDRVGVVQFECEEERHTLVPLDMGLNSRGAWIRCENCGQIHHAEVHHE